VSTQHAPSADVHLVQVQQQQLGHAKADGPLILGSNPASWLQGVELKLVQGVMLGPPHSPRVGGGPVVCSDLQGGMILRCRLSSFDSFGVFYWPSLACSAAIQAWAN